MTERTKLEKRIIAAAKAGEEWANRYETWLQLDSDEKSFLAALMQDIKKTKEGKVSVAELEMEARASTQFREYLKGLSIAKGEELRAKVKYENARDWFEAARSQESTEREKMKTFKHIP